MISVSDRLFQVIWVQSEKVGESFAARDPVWGNAPGSVERLATASRRSKTFRDSLAIVNLQYQLNRATIIIKDTDFRRYSRLSSAVTDDWDN